MSTAFAPVGNHAQFDLIILGSGLGGSLAAMIARQRGLSVAICDPTPHPRFAIGESLTPAASMGIAAIADEFDLPELAPLASYGTWVAEYPELMRGRKRGFVYVNNTDDPQPLVAIANSSDEVADVNAVRANLDRFFLASAVRRGVRLVAANPIAQAYRDGTWRLVFERSEPVRGRMLLASNALPRGLDDVRPIASPFAYRSRLTYTHQTDCHPDDLSDLIRADSPDFAFPFDPIWSAHHTLYKGGWGWHLPFDDGRCSIGLEVDSDDRSLPELRDDWLHAAENDDAIAQPPGRWLELDSPQRCCNAAGGEALALMPHAFGFVTPLHSTGLMSTIAAAPIAVDALIAGDTEPLTKRYRDLLDTVDRLAMLAKLTRTRPQAFEAAICHYLAAAIAGETTFNRTRPLLLSHDPAFRQQLDEAITRAGAITSNADEDAFFAWSGERLRAFCPVPLCDDTAARCYTATAAR